MRVFIFIISCGCGQESHDCWLMECVSCRTTEADGLKDGWAASCCWLDHALTAPPCGLNWNLSVSRISVFFENLHFNVLDFVFLMKVVHVLVSIVSIQILVWSLTFSSSFEIKTGTFFWSWSGMFRRFAFEGPDGVACLSCSFPLTNQGTPLTPGCPIRAIPGSVFRSPPDSSSAVCAFFVFPF